MVSASTIHAKGTSTVASILLVDDERKTAEEVVAGLTRAGHRCTIETSGSRVLDTAKRGKFDLIVLDIMLPGTSGFEVCRRIRRDADLYTVPVLILSAMNGEEEVLHGLAQGADDYVAKPFNMNNLLQRVEALLRANVANSGVDEITSLPGADSTKREIQKRISRQENFALAYGELVNIRDFGRKYGAEARDRAIRHLARGMLKCGQEVAPDRFFVGHMGSGHFVAMLSPERVETFCNWVRKVWAGHVEKLYRPLQQAAGDGRTTGQQDNCELDVLFCVSTRERRDSVTPQSIFKTLTQIRNKALATKGGGVHIDRRSLR